MLNIIFILNLLTLVGVAWLIQASTERRGSRGKNQILLDTSAIIDGRIEAVVRAGFLPSTLLVPEFILAELQHIADSSDELRRSRGRFGLELVRKLQGLSEVKLVVIPDGAADKDKVDDKLVAIAKKIKADIVTTDFNLNKVATINDVKVLNVNELAQSLRPTALPGERLKLKLVQRGSDARQGVGYLNDGTMVVVDRADKLIGMEIEVYVTRIMQTVAGKMLFASIAPKETQTNSGKLASSETDTQTVV